MTIPLHLSWVPGTVDRVRFEHEGQIFTVFLRDVPRADAHSLGALYLRGRVRLRVSALHHAQLTGVLAQTVTGTARRPAVPDVGADAAPRAVRAGLPPTDWDGRD